MSNQEIVWLSPADRPEAFPNIENALDEPDGLLAAGGDLSSERLLAAYANGIFPWSDEGQPILWWSPDPRCVLHAPDFHVSRRLQRTIARSTMTLSFNQEFGEVIRACAGERKLQHGTWITQDMISAYEQLHGEGWAHSTEVWDSGRLVAGVYGLAIGKVFFGESMFCLEANASKLALLGLCQQLAANDFALIDCQVVSPHLITLGATTMPRVEFAKILRYACNPATQFDHWPKKTLPIRDLLPWKL